MTQMLTRQLAEARDSLHYSNKLYEQLEVKLEESEKSSKQLEKWRRSSEALLEKRSTNIGDMEKELTQFREERTHLQAELDKLRRGSNLVAVREFDQLRKSISPRKERSPVGKELFDDDSVDDASMSANSEEIVRLRNTVRDLSKKLQCSVSQKRQLEIEIEELSVDNAGLRQNVEKMDGDMSILQIRLEEAQERSLHLLDGGVAVEGTPPIALGSQYRYHQCIPVSACKMDAALTAKVTPDRAVSITSDTTLDTTTLDTTTLDTTTLGTTTLDMTNLDTAILDTTTLDTTTLNTTTSDTITELAPASDSIETTTNGKSIFSELDSEYSSLQQQYQNLLTNCVCSAQHNVVEKSNITRSSSISCGRRGAFKELFDELFATLRQTAQVADKLMEGKIKN